MNKCAYLQTAACVGYNRQEFVFSKILHFRSGITENVFTTLPFSCRTVTASLKEIETTVK